MRLGVSTVLLQWAAGGLFFGWVTTRRREVGIGYGWTLRITYIVMALGAGLAGRGLESDHGSAALVRDIGSFGVAVAAGYALWLSWSRRKAGVAGDREIRRRRAARVEAMIGRARPERFTDGPEFPPESDLVAPALGLVAILAAASAATAGATASPYLLVAARFVVGAAFLGAVTDAMLLGHWYLTQPGLSRDPLNELVKINAWLWPLEVALLCWPTGMISVLNGTLDDGSNGIFGWIWGLSAISTICLYGVVWAALRERWYSAVMAATGLLYLAILTAFGTDLVARAVLAP